MTHIFDSPPCSDEGVFGNNRTSSEHDGHEVMEGDAGDQAAALFDGSMRQRHLKGGALRAFSSADDEHSHTHSHSHDHGHDLLDEEHDHAHAAHAEGGSLPEYVDGRHRHSRTNGDRDSKGDMEGGIEGEQDLLQLFQRDPEGFEDNVQSLFTERNSFSGAGGERGKRGLEGVENKDDKDSKGKEKEDDHLRRPDIFVFQVGAMSERG